MQISIKIILIFILFIVSIASGEPPHSAITQPIPIYELVNFDEYSEPVKKLIMNAYELSTKNLTYSYGSADPKNQGMDCSGTIYYLLKKANITDPPREANTIYRWVLAKGKFNRVNSPDLTSPDFNQLQPGNLLFWSGTYTTHDASAITHVMIYLGKNKKGQPLMFGSSDGRSYQGQSMWGVSVFDFKMPPPGGSSKFIGYSCIPNLTCAIP